ncbi:MAG: hypothetical protein R6X29_07530 [Acidimicrobiia bacterium]
MARHADSWHAAYPDHPDELVPKVEALRHWYDIEGRDPHTIEWGLGVEPDDLDRFLAEDADTYREMGFTQFTLGFNGPEWRLPPAPIGLRGATRSTAEARSAAIRWRRSSSRAANESLKVDTEAIRACVQ